MSATIVGSVRLQPGERVIRRFSASFVMPGLIYGTLATVLLSLYALTDFRWFLLGAATILVTAGLRALARMQFTWVLTNQRIIAASGILNRKTISIRGDRITDTEIDVPFLGSVFGTGELRISTAGSEGYQMTLFSQHNPRMVEQLLSDLRYERLA